MIVRDLVNVDEDTLCERLLRQPGQVSWHGQLDDIINRCWPGTPNSLQVATVLNVSATFVEFDSAPLEEGTGKIYSLWWPRFWMPCIGRRSPGT
jgi:hypothetical protein